MNFRSIKFFILLFTFCGSLISYGQKSEPARICFFRTDKMICNSLNFDIQINKRDIYTIKSTIKKNVALEYLVSSEGRLYITIKNWMNDWTASTVLDVSHGKTYYVKIDCSISGIFLTTNSVIGQNEWPMASKDFVSTIAEDPAHPLIEKPEPEEQKQANNQVTTIVKVDTVKQYIYLNENKKFTFEPFSDVDFNIPSVNKINDQTFALIIGNEDYTTYQPDLKKEVNVHFAKNDASAFKEYVVKSLGVPEKNIHLILDGTYGQISQAISKINLITKSTGGKANIIFYYAGHGMPDETTKEPYLIPVDISGSNVTSGIKLKDVYAKLTEFPSEKVYVFLDACFTGGARDEGLIAGRSISIKPKEQLLKGNIVVFSASSGNQPSLAFPDKKHGMFTYYLLKKIQESKADISLQDLSAYVKEKVGLESLLINNKEQNPQTNTSATITDVWGKWKLSSK